MYFHKLRVQALDKISVSKHEKYLRQLRCCVCRSPFVTLHHCHGGSILYSGWSVGMGQKQNPFLQMPLTIEYHTGDDGIDRIGVETWESRYGNQTDHLKWVNDQLPYDIFQQARFWEERNRSTGIAKSPTTELSSIASESEIDTSS